jgi:FtsH-binding integral membrane protein
MKSKPNPTFWYALLIVGMLLGIWHFKHITFDHYQVWNNEALQIVFVVSIGIILSPVLKLQDKDDEDKRILRGIFSIISVIIAAHLGFNFYSEFSNFDFEKDHFKDLLIPPIHEVATLTLTEIFISISCRKIKKNRDHKDN